jgi:parallel beta-helix repeat protein
MEFEPMLSSLLQSVASNRITSIDQSRRRPVRNRRLTMEGLESRHLLATLVVDDDLFDCKKAGFTSIQAAVTAAQPGDKVQVCEGTYTEQVTIPATKDGLELRSKKKLAAVIQAPPGMTQPGIVHVDGADNVTIHGFTIRGPFSDLAGLRTGIFVGGGGSAEITENHITAIRAEPLNGAQNGVGILVGRGSMFQTGTAVIRKNLIDDYQKGGIVIDNVGSTATIEHNEIVGAGPTGLIAQNGIQVSTGATAEIKHNLVSGNDYTGPGFVATGILLFASGQVSVEHNEITENQRGIQANSATDLVIAHNDIFDNSNTGIFLDTVTESLIAHNNVHNNGRHGIFVRNSDNNVIEHNKVEDNSVNGIHVTGTSSDNLISKNKMKDNGGFDCFDDTFGTGTAGTANFWEGNSGDTENRPGLCS